MHNTCDYPPQAVLKVLARLKCSVPLYKTEDEFLILTEECLTFETVTSCLAQRLRSHLLAGLWAVALSCMFSPDFKIAGEEWLQEGTIIPFPADSVRSFLRTSGGTPNVFARVGRFCTEFSSNPVSSGVVRILQGRTPDIACSPMTSAISMFEYSNGALQTAVYTVFRYFCFRPFCFRVCE